ERPHLFQNYFCQRLLASVSYTDLNSYSRLSISLSIMFNKLRTSLLTSFLHTTGLCSCTIEYLFDRWLKTETALICQTEVLAEGITENRPFTSNNVVSICSSILGFFSSHMGSILYMRFFKFIKYSLFCWSLTIFILSILK